MKSTHTIPAEHDLEGRVSFLLDHLASCRQELETLTACLEGDRRHILEPVKQQLDNLDTLYAPRISSLQAHLKSTEEAVKLAVLSMKRTVRGHNGLMAVYSSPQVLWDSKKLDGLMVAYPALRDLRSEGKASIRIQNARNHVDQE